MAPLATIQEHDTQSFTKAQKATQTYVAKHRQENGVCQLRFYELYFFLQTYSLNVYHDIFWDLYVFLKNSPDYNKSQQENKNSLS